jgi:hypothetical protein
MQALAALTPSWITPTFILASSLLSAEAEMAQAATFDQIAASLGGQWTGDYDVRGGWGTYKVAIFARMGSVGGIESRWYGIKQPQARA